MRGIYDVRIGTALHNEKDSLHFRAGESDLSAIMILTGTDRHWHYLALKFNYTQELPTLHVTR